MMSPVRAVRQPALKPAELLPTCSIPIAPVVCRKAIRRSERSLALLVSVAASADLRWPSPTDDPPFWMRQTRVAPETSGTLAASADPDAYSLSVVHVTAEMAPIAKVGGLGDVITGLSKACLQRGHHVRVVLPFYECLRDEDIEGLQHERDFDCPKGRIWDGRMTLGSLRTSVYTGHIDGVPVVLVRPDWGSCSIFRGGRIYGGSCSELEAYLYLCRAALEYLKVSGSDPDIIHVHEWQTSALPMLYWEAYHSQGLSKARIVLTIHCLDNPGECRQEEFAISGLSGEGFATVDKALDERTIGHNPERLCLMKGGMVYSNAVTTVSPGYANEAMTGGAAGFLHATLAQPHIRSKFQGVLNGIDVSFWDASRDPLIPASFSQDDMTGKSTCKRYLQKGLGMRESDGPVVACITRLVPQKACLLGDGCCNSGSWLYESACRNTFPPDCTVVPAALQAGVYVHELRELKRRAYTSYSMQWVGQWSRGGRTP